MPDFSPAAARLLAVFPAKRPITLRRAAHLAGLTTNLAVAAASELVQAGLIEPPAAGGNPMLRRTEAARMSRTFEYLATISPPEHSI